jgi:hypothetical protein
VKKITGKIDTDKVNFGRPHEIDSRYCFYFVLRPSGIKVRVRERKRIITERVACLSQARCTHTLLIPKGNIEKDQLTFQMSFPYMNSHK